MPDEVDLAQAELVGEQAVHLAGERGRGEAGRCSLAVAETGQVQRVHGVVLGEGRHDVAPGVPGLWPAVQQDQWRTGAAGDVVRTPSTLSRLENGRLRPTLEQVLPLARAHGVPIEDLVQAPQTGDPRIHLRPVRRYGLVVVPLTRRAGGTQGCRAAG